MSHKPDQNMISHNSLVGFENMNARYCYNSTLSQRSLDTLYVCYIHPTTITPSCHRSKRLAEGQAMAEGDIQTHAAVHVPPAAQVVPLGQPEAKRSEEMSMIRVM